MARKIIGAILLISALALLIYNIFYRKDENYGDSFAQSVPEETRMHTNESVPETETDDTESDIFKDTSTEEYNMANSVIYEFIEYINQNDYESAYKMLNEAYKEFSGIPYEAFKLKYAYDREKAFKCETFIKVQDGYMLTGYLIDYYGGEAEDTENTYIPCSFTVYGTEPATIADAGIISYKEINKTYKIDDGINFNIIKETVMDNGIIVTAKLQNGSDKGVTINNGNYGFYAKNGTDFYPHRLINSVYTDYTIKPGETKSYKILFPKAVYIEKIGITLRNGEKILIGE